MVKFSISEVPNALNIEDRSHEETERRRRCARSKAWNLFQKQIKASKMDKYILLARGRMGPRGSVNKRAGGKRVCGRFLSESAYSQQERPRHCRIGDHDDIKESYDRDDGQRRGANQRRSDGTCQAIGLIRQNSVS